MSDNGEKDTLADRIFDLQLALVRRLHDSHISIQVSQPELKRRRDELQDSDHTGRYRVPKIDNPKNTARRKDKDVAEVLDSYITTGVYESAIIAAVSLFEAFLQDVIGEVLLEYPAKLSIQPEGGSKAGTVPLDVVLARSTYRGVLKGIIGERKRAFLYASPEQYLGYLKAVVGVEVSDRVFSDFQEIKAARDLVVHNRSQINELYLRKAGKSARGEDGEDLVVDTNYFDHVVGTLKQCSVVILEHSGRVFGKKKA